jgi:hypothetical protein
MIRILRLATRVLTVPSVFHPLHLHVIPARQVILSMLMSGSMDFVHYSPSHSAFVPTFQALS